MTKLKNLGVTIYTIKEGIDSSNPCGRMVFHAIGATDAEFESEMITARSLAGHIF